jgi:xylulose-5-phosphate/fructose-6-phosphate phosphoketolase
MSTAATSTATLIPEELRLTHAFWRACNYLALGMIYLQDNPLLRKPLEPSQIKSRLLGHWGASPGLSFVYTHLNRLIKKHDLDVIVMAGPGHGDAARGVPGLEDPLRQRGRPLPAPARGRAPA